MRKIRKYPLSFILAAAVLIFLIGISLFAQEADYNHQDLMKRFIPPLFAGGNDPAHPLGTDQLGRDMLARIIAGIRISFFIALIGTLIGACLGTLLGFLAARFSGMADEAVMMLVDIQASLPFILLAVALLPFVENAFLVLVMLLGVAGWERYARLTRSLALSAVNHGYARAAYGLGASSFRIYFRHILPNISSALIVNMTLNFPGTMIAESSLSFLGLGVQPPMVSLGRLLGEGRDYILTAWWIAILPGAVIFIATLAITVIGDWVRDHFGVE